MNLCQPPPPPPLPPGIKICEWGPWCLDYQSIQHRTKRQLIYFLVVIISIKLEFLLPLQALIFNENSSISARGCALPSNNEFVFGNSLSSMHAPATPIFSNLETNLLALLKFPYPVSASRRIGTSVASLMNSNTSVT